MYPPIFEVCSASAAVKTALGTSPVRLYPYGEAPQGVTKPYAVWQTVGGAPENYISNLPDADFYAVQVDVYATTATAARNAAKALRDAIEPVAHITRWSGEGRDADTQNYRFSFDADWWLNR